MRERRKTFRVEWNSPAMIYDSKGRFARECIVSNFSNGGAKVTGIEIATVPDEFICASRRIAARTLAVSPGVPGTAWEWPLRMCLVLPAIQCAAAAAGVL